MYNVHKGVGTCTVPVFKATFILCMYTNVHTYCMCIYITSPGHLGVITLISNIDTEIDDKNKNFLKKK